jgi:hypothetical protein
VYFILNLSRDLLPQMRPLPLLRLLAQLFSNSGGRRADIGLQPTAPRALLDDSSCQA